METTGDSDEWSAAHSILHNAVEMVCRFIDRVSNSAALPQSSQQRPGCIFAEKLAELATALA
jgi:hypothetical protein